MNMPAQGTRQRSITGVLLAGGQSRRMGGGDKGLLEIAGKPMLAHVLSRLKPQVNQVVINANGDATRFESFGLPVFADTIEGHVGPLAGVLAGMRWSAANVADDGLIVTVSTDAPLIPMNLVQRLADGLKHNRETAIALASSGGNVHPVIGLWPVELADDLESALREGVRKVRHWTDRHGTVIVDFEYVQAGGRTIDPFFNANTPDELEEVRVILGAL